MRYWEIDFVRGLAVIGMVIYHLLVDLELFFGWQIGVFDYPIVFLSRIVGFIFTFLLGLSTYLQYQKEKSSKSILKRACLLLLWALPISITTYLIFPNDFIYFGILHLLGFSLLLLIPLLNLKSPTPLFLLGFTIIILGTTINTPTKPSLDFYPPLPWFGFSVLGLAFAKIYSPWRITKQMSPRLNLIQNLGRHSLFIYLAHQPFLLVILYLISRIHI